MVSLIERFHSRGTAGDAYGTITSALKHDVSLLELIDEHDPLGIAFYIYAIIECNYISVETNELAEAGRLWAIEKLSGQTALSVYKDRDVSAVALLVYSMPGMMIGSGITPLSEFVRPFVEPNGSVFSSFFCSTLVALAIHRTEPSAKSPGAIREYVNQQLRDRYSIVTNDPKNLLLAFWWARDLEQHSLLNKLVLSAKDMVAEVQPNLDALVHASFVLLERAALVPRRERALVKRAVEKAISAIEASTAESLTPATALAYGRDAAAFPDARRRPDLEGKPRLSRILIAVGLMLQESYTKKAVTLLSLKARCLQVYRGLQGCLLSLGASWLIWTVGDRLGLPVNTKALLSSHNSQLFAKAFFVCFPMNLLFAAMLFAPAFIFYHFFVDLLVCGRPLDELDVLKRGWRSFKDYYWIEIALVLITTIAFAAL
jgi:hypothetical protein